MEKLEDILDSYLSQTESCKDKIYTAALLQIGGKRYPKFGNVLILAGGCGSGKTFQLSKLIGLEGKVMSIDKLESLMIKSEYWNNKIYKEKGIRLRDLDLNNPDDVKTFRKATNDTHIQSKLFKALKYLKDIEQNRPNLIFDATLHSYSKFKEICKKAKQFGYDKRNIHLIWVLNELETSIKQNKSRRRFINDDDVRGNHENVSLTLYNILKQFPKNISKHLDGDIWISFNQIDVDIESEGEKNKGFYIKEANAFKVKSVGNQIEFPEKYEKEIIRKIAEYTHESYWLD